MTTEIKTATSCQDVAVTYNAYIKDLCQFLVLLYLQSIKEKTEEIKRKLSNSGARKKLKFVAYI